MRKKKNKNKVKKEHTRDSKKIVFALKIVIILCILVLVCEGIYIGLQAYKKEQATIYIDTLATVESIEDGYIGVGSSDYKYSKFNSYSKEYEKAKLVKYNKDHNIVFETAYTKGYNSYFNDIAVTEDGYIAVGGGQYSKQQVDDIATDGLIVIYDKKGKQIDSKRVQIAGDTVFTKIEIVEDGYLIIGQSILENMVLGTDPKGGAIMIKYDKDLKEVWRTNYGGSKSAIFNDVYVDDDAIYAVGKDATRYGMFVKYDKDGNRQFVKTYEYTDTIGFSAIEKIGDDFVVVGSRTMNIDAEDKNKKTEALILKYNQDGKIIFEKTYQQNNASRFNSVLVDDGEIIAVGHTYKKDEEKSTDAYNVLRYSGIFAKYSKDGEEIIQQKEEGSKDTYFSDILKIDDTYLIVGQSSSKELGGNNKDLKSYFLYYDKDGKKVGYAS